MSLWGRCLEVVELGMWYFVFQLFERIPHWFPTTKKMNKSSSSSASSLLFGALLLFFSCFVYFFIRWLPIWVGTAFPLRIAFGRIVSATKLILPIREHGKKVSSLAYFFSVQFSLQSSFISWLFGLFLERFDATGNRYFPNFFLGISLFVNIKYVNYVSCYFIKIIDQIQSVLVDSWGLKHCITWSVSNLTLPSKSLSLDLFLLSCSSSCSKMCRK